MRILFLFFKTGFFKAMLLIEFCQALRKFVLNIGKPKKFVCISFFSIKMHKNQVQCINLGVKN